MSMSSTYAPCPRWRQRVAIYNVSFDDLTLVDWKRAAVGEITAPFTFTRFELLDQIDVQ